MYEFAENFLHKQDVFMGTIFLVMLMMFFGYSFYLVAKDDE